MTAETSAPSARTRIRRISDRALYDRETLYAIVDEAYLCHIAFQDAHGPHCLPMACWRIDDHLYIHGANGGRLMRRLGEGAPVCVTVTHLDGLVLARSAFNHSMNYRSAVVYGVFERVTDETERRESLARFMNHLAPGRHDEARQGSDKEFAATTVLRLALGEAACKVRSGGPEDDAQDMALPVWAGVLPLSVQRGAPQVSPDCAHPAPGYVQTWASAREEHP